MRLEHYQRVLARRWMEQALVLVHHSMEPEQHWTEQEPEHQGHWWEGSCTQSR